MQSSLRSGIVLVKSGTRHATARRIHIVAFLLTLSLAGCWDDGPIAEEEEAEILFGSSQEGGGSLLTTYDFGEAVAVTLSSELPGVRIYSGTDPGFVSLGTGATQEPYGMPDGVEVTIRITEIDSGVRLTFNGVVLAEAGDATPIGVTPIHMHPQWQLIAEEGVDAAPQFVTFTFSAPGYGESPAYTATLIVANEADHHEHE